MIKLSIKKIIIYDIKVEVKYILLKIDYIYI
jgi:hypothetical protein